jgi:hypothetical protein
MHLEAEGMKVRIAQLGPDFVILGEIPTVQMKHAEIVFRVDASERRWTVDLPQGLAGPSARTPIVNRA